MLSINVGLSRKASRNYQSTGVSINITAELDPLLLVKPQELQKRIGELYAQAQGALDWQAQVTGELEPSQARFQDDGGQTSGTNPDPPRDNGNGHANNGRRINGNGSHATPSQRRAIAAIAHHLGVDPTIEANQVIGATLDDLTCRQASALIDHLKSLGPDTNGRNSR